MPSVPYQIGENGSTPNKLHFFSAVTYLPIQRELKKRASVLSLLAGNRRGYKYHEATPHGFITAMLKYGWKLPQIDDNQTIPAGPGGHVGGGRLGHFSRIGLRRVEARYGYSTKELCFFLFL